MVYKSSIRYAAILLVGFVFLLLSSTTFAHHPMGNLTPGNPWQGLLSGMGHPLIGLDHLTFVIALGLLAAWQTKSGVGLLAGFLPATVFGALGTVGGVTLPFVELGVAFSVVLIGAALFAGWAGRRELLISFAALSGLFHGLAYGEAIVGAETNPIVAYLVGFLIIQSAIAFVFMYLVRSLGRGLRGDAFVVGSRSVGVAIGSTGLVFVVQALVG